MSAAREPIVEPVLCYIKHDPVKLGGYYTRHVEAMTAEGLERKSEIANQLAWRDQEIDRLKGENAKLLDAIDVVVHEQHGATVGIVDLHIIAGKRSAHSIKSKDTLLLDWLDNNIFHQEPSGWDAKISTDSSLWRIYGVKGVQGTARAILTAALDRSKGGR